MFIGSNVGQVGRVFSGSGSATAPALDLGFLGGVLDPRITFTRPSVATYFDSAGTLQTVGNHVPRFDYDPVTHVPLGLLIEEARTNLMLQSADLSNAAWSKTGVVVAGPTVTANQIVAPDGTTTAARIDLPAITGAGALSRVAQAPTATVAAYSFSIYLRGAVGGEQPYLYATDSTTYYRTLVTLTTSWQRFTLITSNLAATLWFFAVGADLRDVSQSARSAMSIYAWGGQIEVGPFPSSYIPTTGVTVTRFADNATMPLVPVFPSAMVVDAMSPSTVAATRGLVVIDDGGSTNRVSFRMAPTNAVTLLYNPAGSVVTAGGSITPSTPFKAGASMQPTALGVTIDGGAVVSAAGTAPSGLTTLRLGQNAVSVNYENGYIRRMRYWSRALSNAELQSVTGEPSLDLSFFGPTLDPQITFTRASVGTYFDATGVMQTAASGAPRFDCDPVTRAARGLLIEEARTNYALQSGAMASATYLPFRATMTANAAVVPDGSNSGARLTEDTNTNTHPVQAIFAAIPVNAPVAASVYVKADGRTNLNFIIYDNVTQANNASANFDLSAGTAAGVVVTGAAVAGTSSITYVGNGWYRITLTATLSATATTGILYRIYPLVAGTASYTGDGASGLFLWGAQLEAGAFPTSYIPTAGASVTRAADVATAPLGPWYNSAAGAFAAEFLAAQGPPPGFQAGVLRWDDSSQNNNAGLWLSSTGNLFAYAGAVANTAQLNATIAPLRPSAVNRIASTYGAANWTATGNGAAIQNGTGNAVLVSPNRLMLGGSSTTLTAWKLNGALQRVRYWPRQLSNTELQSVAT